jgi:hypothetical protein
MNQTLLNYFQYSQYYWGLSIIFKTIGSFHYFVSYMFISLQQYFLNEKYNRYLLTLNSVHWVQFYLQEIKNYFFKVSY